MLTIYSLLGIVTSSDSNCAAEQTKIKEIKMYNLTATNDSGASVYYSGNTIKEVIKKFDADYHRKGWAIEVTDNTGEVVKTVKKTCR